MSVPNIRPTPVVLEVFVCNHFTGSDRFNESTVHLSYKQALHYAAQRCFVAMEKMGLRLHEREYLEKF